MSFFAAVAVINHAQPSERRRKERPKPPRTAALAVEKLVDYLIIPAIRLKKNGLFDFRDLKG